MATIFIWFCISLCKPVVGHMQIPTHFKFFFCNPQQNSNKIKQLVGCLVIVFQHVTPYCITSDLNYSMFIKIIRK